MHEQNPMLGLRGVRLGLVIPGLHDGRPVQYVGWRPYETTEAFAQYVAVVKVTADLAVDMADQDETTEEPLSIAGTVPPTGGSPGRRRSACRCRCSTWRWRCRTCGAS